MTIDTNQIYKSCIDAIQWWIRCNQRYHSTFSTTDVLLRADINNRDSINQQFLQFTKDYSVRRTIHGDQTEDL